jgi:hypothetical protein
MRRSSFGEAQTLCTFIEAHVLDAGSQGYRAATMRCGYQRKQATL